MNTRIIATETPEDHPTFEVTPQAVYELHMHGWEPPAGQEFHVTFQRATGTWEELHIPARPRQRTSLPTQDELELVILSRIAGRLDHKNHGTLGDTADAVVKAAGDAAEAILDILGATQ